MLDWQENKLISVAFGLVPVNFEQVANSKDFHMVWQVYANKVLYDWFYIDS